MTELERDSQSARRIVLVGFLVALAAVLVGARLAPAVGAAAPVESSSVEAGVDRPGGDYERFPVPDASVDRCRQACESADACRAWTSVRPGVQEAQAVCWLKNSVPAASANVCCTSGVVVRRALSGSTAQVPRTSGRWVLDRVDPAAAAEAITHTPGTITKTGPIASFTATYDAPPAEIAADTTVALTVRASGQLVSTTTRGEAGIDVIQLLNDRWTRVSVGSYASCQPNPFPLGPVTCTPPGANSGAFTYRAPASGTTFAIGVGVLNANSAVTWRYRFEPPAASATTRPATQTSAPAPTTTRASTSRRVVTLLGISRQLPRLGVPGAPDELTTIEAVTPPEGLRVELIVRRGDRLACRAGDQFRFGIGARAVAATRLDPTATGACRYELLLPEGVHTLSMTMAAEDGVLGTGTLRVSVQDWLVFGLGDSNGAGEGAPADGTGWTSSRCHRSVQSFQSQVARRVEDRDELTSVSFVHLACSGASIIDGLLGPYAGIEVPDPPEPPLPAQVEEMKRLANGREIDAVVISIGINDIGFGDLVAFCIANADCSNARGFVRSPLQTLGEFVDAFFRTDPRASGDTIVKRYEQLAGALRRARVKDDRVFVAQYFDPTRDQSGNICDPLISVPTGTFDRAEAQWAYDRVLSPLNRAVRAAAQRHGWKVVTGVAEGFATHGYCAGGAAWIRSVLGSAALQFDTYGALHATPEGNAFTASRVLPVLTASLYAQSGTPRAPARA